VTFIWYGQTAIIYGSAEPFLCVAQYLFCDVWVRTCAKINPYDILASPGFCRPSGSGREPERLHRIAVLSFDDEFREAVACGGIQQKFRHAVAQRIGHH